MTMKINDNRSHFLEILKYLLSFGILFYLFYKLDFTSLFIILKNFSFFYFVVACCFFCVSTFLAAISLHVLLTSSFQISFLSFLREFLHSRIFNLVLPAKIGDFWLIYPFKKKLKINTATIVLPFFIDKLITLSLIGIFICFFWNKFLYILNFKLSFVNLMNGFLIYFIILVLFQLIFSFKPLFLFFLFFKKAIFYNYLLTILRLLIIVFQIKFLFYALGVGVNLQLIFFALVFEISALFIPLTVNGIGVKEGLGILIYNFFGIPNHILFARYCLDYLIQFSFAAFFFIFAKKIFIQR